jgi:hypothetical protein
MDETRNGIAARPSLARWQVVLASAAIALLIVATCAGVFGRFFLIDDADDQNLPFFFEMGRLWLSGQLPIFTTRTWLGGNILVDMVMSPFAPQTILVSILTQFLHHWILISYVFAWVNEFIIILAGYALARGFGIGRALAFPFTFCIATLPVYIYFFAASWWNFAISYVWFIAGFAALAMLYRAPSRFHLAVAIFCGCAMFTTAGAQIQLAYLLTLAGYLVVAFAARRRLSDALPFLIVGVCTFLIALVPVAGEYVVAAYLLDRYSDFNNFDNFLVPSWNAVLNLFNPLQGTDMRLWTGYGYLPIPLGYVSILALFLVFCEDVTKLLSRQRLLLALAGALFLLASGPSQSGPIRYPFRFLPSLGVCEALALFVLLQTGRVVVSRTRAICFLVMTVGAAWLQLIVNPPTALTFAQCWPLAAFVGLAALIFASALVFGRRGTFPPASVMAVIGFLGFAGMLGQTFSMVQMGWPFPRLPDRLADNPPYNGYMLNLCWPSQARVTQADISSSQALLYGLKSVNGYSPMGYGGFSSFVGTADVHGWYVPQVTLHNMVQPAPGLPGTYWYQLFQLGRITACAPDAAALPAAAVAQAGLVQSTMPDGRVLLTPAVAPAARGSLAYVSADGGVTIDRTQGERDEWYAVAPAATARTAIFARIYWPGYHARMMDGRKLEVSSYQNMMVQVTIPPGAGGEMHLYYEPVSWRYTRWSLLLGLILGVAGIWWIGSRRRLAR